MTQLRTAELTWGEQRLIDFLVANAPLKFTPRQVGRALSLSGCRPFLDRFARQGLIRAEVDASGVWLFWAEVVA